MYWDRMQKAYGKKEENKETPTEAALPEEPSAEQPAQVAAETPPEKTPEQLEEEQLQLAATTLAKYIWDVTAKSKVVGQKTLQLQPPQGVSKERLHLLLPTIGTADVRECLKNVTFYQAKKDVYYYDRSIMTAEFAEIECLLEDKDILATIAQAARTDSKLYPRPTQYSKLMDYPYRYSLDEVEGAAARMRFEEQYADIQVVQATNGAKAFYSTKYLTAQYAKALLQMIEVEEDENP